MGSSAMVGAADNSETSPMTPPQFFTIEQTAEILACSVRHIKRLIEAKRLVAVDIGIGSTREWRISGQAIREMGSALKTTDKIETHNSRRGPRIVKMIIPDAFSDPLPPPRRRRMETRPPEPYTHQG
jgi:excisionase family DNA binding protein